MNGRPINITLAILAALVALVGLALRDVYIAVPGLVCAVVFGLEAGGVRTLGRTRRGLRDRRGGRDG